MSAPPLFHLSRDGETVTGPHAAGYLRQGLESGGLTLDTLTCLDGTQDWLPMWEFAAEIGMPKPQPAQSAKPSRKGPRPAAAVSILLVVGIAAFASIREYKKTKSRQAAAENLERLRVNAETSRIAAEIEGKVRDYMESKNYDPIGIRESRRKWNEDGRKRKRDEIDRQYDRKKINFAEKEMLLKAIDDEEKKEEEEEKRETSEIAERYRRQLEEEEEDKKERIEEWNKEHPDHIRTYP